MGRRVMRAACLSAALAWISPLPTSAQDLVVPIEKGQYGALNLKAEVQDRPNALAVTGLGVALKYLQTDTSVAISEAGELSFAGARTFDIDGASVTSRLAAGAAGKEVSLSIKIPIR